MSITYPRAMPSAGAKTQSFELARVDYPAPEDGGTVGGVQVGAPRWAAQWDLGTLSRDGSDEWRAFIQSMQGTIRLFLGRDYNRPFPTRYPFGFTGLNRAGGGAFDGSLTSWSQSVDSAGVSTLTGHGLPAGLVLRFTDYVSLKWTTGGAQRRFLVRSMEAVVAAGDGSVSMVVDPAIPDLVPSTAVAHLDNPDCLMKLIQGQTPLGGLDRRGAVSGTVSAIQVILP